MLNEEERQRIREEKIKRMHSIDKLGEALTDEDIEKLVSEVDLCKKLPIFIRTIDGKKPTAESLDILAKKIRRYMAAEIVMDRGLMSDC